MTRLKTANALYATIAERFTSKNYVVNQELSFNVGKGKLVRADLVALNMKREVVIIEVKSCKQDFLTDKKYHTYLRFCNKLYIGTNLKTAEQIKDLVPAGVGIIVDSRVYKNAKRREMKEKDFMQVLLRFAFRNADYNRIKRHSRKVK